MILWNSCIFRRPADVLDMFWEDGSESLSYFKELAIQERVRDSWRDLVLQECWSGNPSEEMTDYFVGFPTLHAGSWKPTPNGAGVVECGAYVRAGLPTCWRPMAGAGASWLETQALDCDFCKKERPRCNRLIELQDPHALQRRFVSILYAHRSSEPKYHAMLLRAVG